MMGGFGGCCGYGWLGNFGSFGWIGLVFNLLILSAFVIGVVALILWLVRRLRGKNAGAYSPATIENAQNSPQDVLAIRYARGEIDSDQYKKMVSTLDS
jgi:putative membrane protein